MGVRAAGLVPGGRALERLGGLQRAGCGQGQHTGSLTPAGPVVAKAPPRGESLTPRQTPDSSPTHTLLGTRPTGVFNQRFRTCCLQGGTRYEGVVGSR